MELVEQTVHRASIRLHPGWAEIAVRRTVDNRNLGQFGVFWTSFDDSFAALTGLMLQGDQGWLAADLRSPAKARERLLRYGDSDIVGDAAMLSKSRMQAGLTLVGIPPAGRRSVEYRMLVDTTYEDGKHLLKMPPLDGAVLLAPGEPARHLLVDGEPALEVVAREGSPMGDRLELPSRQSSAIDGALAIVELPTQHLVSYRLHVGSSTARVLVLSDLQLRSALSDKAL